MQGSLLLCLLLLNTAVATAQKSQQYSHTHQQHFGVEEGLPQSYVTGIIQDKDGFIWISTLDGFCRYDGRGFKILRYRPDDSMSLAANSINNLEARTNNLVTLYYDGLLMDDFDLRSFKISRNTVLQKMRKIPNTLLQIRNIKNTSDNWPFILADYKGVGWVNSSTGKILYANRANHLLHQDTVSVMIESVEGKLYLVSENGVQVSDTGKQKFEWVPFATTIKKLPPYFDKNIPFENVSIACLPHNKLVVYDMFKITVLDISNKTSRVYPIPPPTTKGAVSTLRTVQVDAKGRPYIENHGRVFRLNGQGELKLLWENADNPGLRISALFIDRSDVLWLSVNAQGLLKIDLQVMPFNCLVTKPISFPIFW